MEPVFRSEVRRGEQVISAYEKGRWKVGEEVVRLRLAEAGQAGLERSQEAGYERQADGGPAGARGGGTKARRASPEACGGAKACTGSPEACYGDAEAKGGERRFA